MLTANSTALAQTDREVLVLIAQGPREYAVDSGTNLRLERKGLIRRIGTARRGRFGSRPAIR